MSGERAKRREWLDWFRKYTDRLHLSLGPPDPDRCYPDCAHTRLVTAGDQPEPRRDTFWLIERGQNRKQTPPIYWRSRGELPSHADEWTADPWQAAQFSSRAAAAEAIHSLAVRLEAVGDPVEHGFIPAAPTPEAAGLREALRAVLSDYDRVPTEDYLNEAVRIFLAATPSQADRGLDAAPCRTCGGSGTQPLHSHTARCLDPVRRDADCDTDDLDARLSQ